MPSVFIYVIDRDFGFAPNPFHGYCTLATCKPRIRGSANVGDWIVGVGGRRLAASGKCIFGMEVTTKLTFNQYWDSPKFRDKIPVRNGSDRMLVGDNIYHQSIGRWHQANSHHSHADGSVNMVNLQKDTSKDAVLVSSNFYYFGRSALEIPKKILKKMGYANVRDYRKYEFNGAMELIQWIQLSRSNLVLDDPFDFGRAHARYSAADNKVVD